MSLSAAGCRNRGMLSVAILYKDPQKDRYNALDSALAALQDKFHSQVCLGAPSCLPECIAAVRALNAVVSARSK